LIENWNYPCPYWFEETDLAPMGLWTSLTADEVGEGPGPIMLQQGQGVRMSHAAIDHFATLLARSDLEGTPHTTIVEVLGRLRGVVRRQVLDEQLLLYLSYPWAWFAESMGRGLKLPFSREQTHQMLVKLGRIGGKPTEDSATPPFRGFCVEWLGVKSGTSPPEGGQKLVPFAPGIKPDVFSPHAQIPLPPPQYMQQGAMGQPMAQAPPVTPMPSVPSVPVVPSAPRGFCKYWLPEAVFVSGQDLKELIGGPQGSHFGHVLKKIPNG